MIYCLLRSAIQPLKNIPMAAWERHEAEERKFEKSQKSPDIGLDKRLGMC